MLVSELDMNLALEVREEGFERGKAETAIEGVRLGNSYQILLVDCNT